MYKIEDIQIQDFGQVGEVSITKDDTLFMKVGCVMKILIKDFALMSVAF